MEALVARLERELGPGWQGKQFRIDRDLRFTKDKRPYKEHVSAFFMASARAAGLYIQLSREGLYLAAGIHEMSPEQLKRYRDAVGGKAGEKLARIVEILNPGTWLETAEALDRVRDGWNDGKPLVAWLELNVGRSTAPGRFR